MEWWIKIDSELWVRVVSANLQFPCQVLFVSDNFHQDFVFYRSGDVRLTCDLLGFACYTEICHGGIVTLYLRRKCDIP